MFFFPQLNGINTQGENIADNGGVKESYIAYRRWAEKHGPEAKLPGLDYTPEQMFWVAAGQTWCAKYRKGKNMQSNRITYSGNLTQETNYLAGLF